MAEHFSMESIKDHIMSGRVNVDKLESTLDDLRLHAYSYLYNLQKDMVNFFKMQVLYADFDAKEDMVFTKIYLNRYSQFNVKIPFIHYNNRLKFRRSKFYNIPITNEIIDSNRNLFIYTYFVFVDGYLDYSARLKCREELTSICLKKEAMSSSLQEKLRLGAKIDILFLPDLDTEALSATKEDLITNNLTFTTGVKLKSNDKVIAFVSSGQSLVKMFDTTITDGKVILPEACVNDYNDSDVIDITIAILPNFLEQIECPEGTDFFKNSKTPMPIPSDNILIWRKNDDGSITIDNSIKVEKKYPDIFKLPDNHKGNLVANIFYWNNTANNHMDYTPETAMYSQVMNMLMKYSNGSINKNIAEFSPYIYQYDLTSYHKGPYAERIGDSLVYKTNKLFDTFKLWAFASQLYHEKLGESINGYIINTAKLDMEAKRRKNNKAELRDASEHCDFEEDRYVFIFSNKMSYHNLPYKFWIDGLRYVPDQLYNDGAYEYVYIPCSMFNKKGSYIEIERSNDVSGDINLIGAENKIPVSLSCLGGGSIPFNSIFVSGPDRKYLNNSQYRFYLQVGMDENEIPLNSKIILTKNSKLSIKILDPALIGKRVTVSFYDRPIEIHASVTHQNFVKHNLNVNGAIHNIKDDTRRIRVFRSGRLMSHSVYNIGVPETVDDKWKIDLTYFGYVDEFQVDYIPEGYNLIYELDHIDDPKAVINLIGAIDKPFSIKYYDVYVNGFRLLPHQIEKLSEFSIHLKGIPSIEKVRIYEKDITVNTLYSMEIEDAKKLLAEKLMEDEDFIDKLRLHLENVDPDLSIDDVDTIDDVLNIIFTNIIEYIESHGGLFTTQDIDDDTYHAYKSLFGHDEVFLIDPNKTYEDESNREDRVYFIRPPRDNELEEINLYDYVDQFSAMMYIFTDRFVNANRERADIHKKFNCIKRHDSGETILLSGNIITKRFGTEVAMLGVANALADIVAFLSANNGEIDYSHIPDDMVDVAEYIRDKFITPEGEVDMDLLNKFQNFIEEESTIFINPNEEYDAIPDSLSYPIYKD